MSNWIRLLPYSITRMMCHVSIDPLQEALTYELGAAPYEGQELEVVQSPHALASRWLHSVGLLQLPHH